jgi:hypothetical protein
MSEKLLLEGCGKHARLFFWSKKSFEEQRHVWKHFLNRVEGWQRHTITKLSRLSKKLRDIKCKGAQHDRSCPTFEKCHGMLSTLAADYRSLIVEALQEGATIPRHTHNQFRHRHTNKVMNTMYFLSEKGVLTEAYENKDGSVRLKTSYRHSNEGELANDREYYRAALELICNTRKARIKVYHTEDSWGCRKQGFSMGDIVKIVTKAPF